jgi:hypothetical protein
MYAGILLQYITNFKTLNFKLKPRAKRQAPRA